MRANLRTSIFVLLGASLSLIFAGTARAQCPMNLPFYADVGLTPNNPFQAEKVITSNQPVSDIVSKHELPPELVARDGQGRVRLERITGEYELDTGPEAGSRVKQHIISICDPVANTFTQIDTLNKSARIINARRRPVTGAIRPQESVCAASFRALASPNAQTDDLGHRVIDGLDAVGIRRTTQHEENTRNGNRTVTNVDEFWCSEELSALVLRTHESSTGGMTIQTALSKLQRQEPDPALFRIPGDYTVSESVPDTKPAHLVPVPPNQP